MVPSPEDGGVPRNRRRPQPTDPAHPLPDPAEIQALLDQCFAGDNGAWDALVSRFSRLVQSTIGRTFLQFDRPDLADLTDDVEQDIFLSLLEDDYRSLRTLRDPGRLPGWLAAVARHKTVDAIRRQTLRPDSRAGLIRESGVEYPTAEAREQDAVRAAMARDALGSLAPRDRLLIELFYFEQRRYRDIALLLGIPENTVASRLYRIKRRLLQHLEGRRPGTEGTT